MGLNLLRLLTTDPTSVGLVVFGPFRPQLLKQRVLRIAVWRIRWTPVNNSAQGAIADGKKCRDSPADVFVPAWGQHQ